MVKINLWFSKLINSKYVWFKLLRIILFNWDLHHTKLNSHRGMELQENEVQQGVQRLKAFTFCVVTVAGSKKSLGVKFKDNKCTKLSLNWFENDWYFCNITGTGCF